MTENKRDHIRKRIKKDYIIITFKTTTAAMAMENRCLKKGIPGRLIPLPGGIAAGCGLCFRMLPEEYAKWEKELGCGEGSGTEVYHYVM